MQTAMTIAAGMEVLAGIVFAIILFGIIWISILNDLGPRHD